jgi:hypothetical protein
MNLNISKKILLYPLFGILIFSIIKVLPNNSLSNFDTILISIITVVLCICLEKTMSSNLCPVPVQTKCGMPTVENHTSKTARPNSNSKEHFDLLKTFKELAKKTKTIEHVTNLSSSTTAGKTTGTTSTTAGTTSTTAGKTSTTAGKTSTTAGKTSTTAGKTSTTAGTTSTTKPTTDKLKTLNTMKPTDTKLNTGSVSTKPNSQETISFPFDYKFLKKTMDDMRFIAENDDKKKREIEQTEVRLQMMSRSNEYFEMLIQLMQRDLDLVYKYVTKDHFNKLNEIIMGLKLRRSELMGKKTNLADVEKLAKTQSRELSETMKKYMRSMSGSGKYIDENGFIQNMIDNDMKYSIYNPKQHEKLGAYDPSFTNKWDNDYVLLNTDKWRPAIGHHMYKCKVEKQCPVCPSLTTGYPVKLKDFDLARKILPPDVINADYIREKLLTGIP